jgi:hypothetical protein
MAIRTSAIFYGRGIKNTNNNFAYVAQTNNSIISPMHKYLRNYNFYNRKPLNTMPSLYRGALRPWNN